MSRQVVVSALPLLVWPLLLCSLPSGVVAANATPHYHAHPGRLRARDFSAPRHRRYASRLLRSVQPEGTAPEGSAVISPFAFGADGTGKSDDSAPLHRSVAALLKLGTGARDEQGRIDLGGAVLDLAGGIFSVSSTVYIPPGYANFGVQRGTLVARANFTSAVNGPYLLKIGDSSACRSSSGGVNNKNCNEDVSVSEITLDCQHYAWGGLLIEDSMDVNVGPSVFVVGFPGVGISLSGSGAGYIHEAWLGEYPPGAKTPRSDATGTAILLDSYEHDCDVNNVIVWSGRVGINSTNGANRLQGVHTWNLAGTQGGTGIRLHSGRGRVEQCYLDFAPLVIGCNGSNASPKTPNRWTASLAMIEGNLFLGTAALVLEAYKGNDVGGTAVHGLVVTGNNWHSSHNVNRTVVLDESRGSFTGVYDTVMENNAIGVEFEAGKNVPAGLHRSTRATLSSAFPAGKSLVTLDFSNALVFGSSVGINIDEVRCALSGSFPMAMSFGVTGNKVTVYLAEILPSRAVGVRVSCSVDQSRRLTPAH